MVEYRLSLSGLLLDMYLTAALMAGAAALAGALLFWEASPAVGAVAGLALSAAMWAASPTLIEAAVGVRRVGPGEEPRLVGILERVSRAAGLGAAPDLVLVESDVPNAFAYGNRFVGYRVAITTGLLEALEPEEVEAVMAHEVSHIAHRDLEIMMLASALPTLVYFAWLGYSGGRRGEAGLAASAAWLSAALWLLSLRLSRLREFYADAHGALISSGGPRALQRALAKMRLRSAGPSGGEGGRGGGLSPVRALAVDDPLAPRPAARSADELIEIIRRGGNLDPTARLPGFGLPDLGRLLATHPRLEDRIRALDSVARQMAAAARAGGGG